MGLWKWDRISQPLFAPELSLDKQREVSELQDEQFHAGTQAMVSEFGPLCSEARNANSL